MSNDKRLIDNIIQSKGVYHSFFWLGYLLFSVILATLDSGNFLNHLIKYGGLLPIQMIASYYLVYYQVPKLIVRKKYIAFFLSFIVFSYTFSALARLCIVHLVEPFIRKDFEQETFVEIISDPYYLFIVYFPSVYGIAFLMLIIKSAKGRMEERQKIEVLEREKVTNELKFLKAQMQPHFLFNTLNNLYALTLSKSDLAPKVVLKLSEILDFILHQSSHTRIPIHKELELLKSFIELEMLRYDDTLQLNFNHDIEGIQTEIAPLLLLPLVENAFKHGVNGSIVDPWINIHLIAKNEQLTFEVSNSKVEKVAKKQLSLNGGIGLVNLKRQLELNYLAKYTLEIEDSTKEYKVLLTLDLS